MNSQGNINNM